MKKTKLFIAASAAILLASCSNQPQTEAEQKKDTKDSVVKENKKADLEPVNKSLALPPLLHR